MPAERQPGKSNMNTRDRETRRERRQRVRFSMTERKKEREREKIRNTVKKQAACKQKQKERIDEAVVAPYITLPLSISPLLPRVDFLPVFSVLSSSFSHNLSQGNERRGKHRNYASEQTPTTCARQVQNGFSHHMK